MYRFALSACCLCVLLLAVPATVLAQDEEEDKTGWANTTDLSFVVTSGNSDTQTLGLADVLTRTWKRSRVRFRFNALKSDTADDRFALVEVPDGGPPDGTDPEDLPWVVITPSRDPDVENYLVEGRYDHKISEKFVWNAGASWDRNKDAGILDRYIAFAGLGNIWIDKERTEFDTSYALSYTDRTEEIVDPTKDETFSGLRLGVAFSQKVGKNSTYNNDSTFNTNLSDTADFSVDMTNAFSVSMGEHLALKVSLQWLFANEPALEEIERFIILDDGTEIQLGDVIVRKDDLDTIFRTSLIVNF
jgi:hypothetical protein